jgi:hypothetical protein
VVGIEESVAWKHSVIEKILTGVTGNHKKTLTWAKWVEGKGKKVQYLINKQIIYNKAIGGGSHNPVFCMVKLLYAELGYARSQ